MSTSFHTSFEYDREKFELVEGKKSENTVQINGLTYSILGPTEKMKEVREVLNSLSLIAVTSQKDLKDKLSSSGKIPASSIKEIGKQTFKAKEAEDLEPTRIPLKRSRSHAAIDKLSNKDEEVSKKSCTLWNCVDRTPDKNSNGFIYRFQLKPEFELHQGLDVTEATKREKHLIDVYEGIFPAIEPSPMDIFFLFSEKTPGPEILNELGYSFEFKENGKVFLNLPDRETLMSRWEKFRERRPELPKLDIVSSDGIADDTDYLRSYFTHDALLSDGAEFVHDHNGHIIEIISYILTSAKNAANNKGTQGLDYTKDKTRLLRTLASFYKKLVIVERALEDNKLGYPQSEVIRTKKELDKLKAALATLADNAAGTVLNRYKDEKEATSWIRGQFNAGFRKYLDNRFGSDVMGQRALSSLWDYVTGVEQWMRKVQKSQKKG